MNQNRITQLLTSNGFKLIRQRKHKIWKHTDGRAWTLPATPSDKRALLNNLKDLENFLDRGKVRGVFGLTPIDDAERADFEKTLHPVIEHKRKETKERNIGIAIERVKIVANTTVPTATFHVAAPAAPDAYTTGRLLEKGFQHVLLRKLEHEMVSIQDDVEQRVLLDMGDGTEFIAYAEAAWGIKVPAARREEFIKTCAEFYIEQNVANERKDLERIHKAICPSSTKLFQRVVKQMHGGVRIDGQTIRVELCKKIAQAHANNWSKVSEEFVADLVLFAAICVLTDGPYGTARIDGSVRLVMGDREITPSQLWDESTVGWAAYEIGHAHFQDVQEGGEL